MGGVYKVIFISNPLSLNIRKYLALCVSPEMTGTSHSYLRWFVSPDQSFRNIYWAQKTSWNVDLQYQNIRRYLTLCVSPEMTGTSYGYLRWFVSPDQSFRNIYWTKETSWNLHPPSQNIRKHLTLCGSPEMMGTSTGTWDDMCPQINHSGTFIKFKKIPEMLIPHLRILKRT